jgi:hypothetical protein
MAMYMAGILIFSIMLIGPWSSTAFLKYIRKEVQTFSHGISSKMLEVQSFKHIQNSTTPNPMKSIVGNSSQCLIVPLGIEAIREKRVTSILSLGIYEPIR